MNRWLTITPFMALPVLVYLLIAVFSPRHDRYERACHHGETRLDDFRYADDFRQHMAVSTGRYDHAAGLDYFGD